MRRKVSYQNECAGMHFALFVHKKEKNNLALSCAAVIVVCLAVERWFAFDKCFFFFCCISQTSFYGQSQGFYTFLDLSTQILCIVFFMY